MNGKSILALALGIGVAAGAVAEPLLTHTDVFVSGADGYNTFRIPAVEAAPDPNRRKSP